MIANGWIFIKILNYVEQSAQLYIYIYIHLKCYISQSNR